MFLLGNWAPGLHTKVQKGETVQIIQRLRQPKEKRHTPDTQLNCSVLLGSSLLRDHERLAGEKAPESILQLSVGLKFYKALKRL